MRTPVSASHMWICPLSLPDMIYLESGVKLASIKELSLL
jgi:hypothetical protein